MGQGLRIVVTGATGNIGTSVLRALGGDAGIAEITGIARRAPGRAFAKAEFVRADVARDELTALFSGADVVVHLAWLFQPTHRPQVTWTANVVGSLRVFEAVVEAKVPKLVCTSSVGAYSPAVNDVPVDESWPTHGWPGAAYTREKAYVERCLDTLEAAHPELQVVRVRPGFVFQRAAASEQRRLFGGPFVPGSLLRPGLLPVLPDIPGLRLQVVHADDLADAVRRCVLCPVTGPFNIATGPVVDTQRLAKMFGARSLRLPPRLARAAIDAAWRLHVVPATAELFDAVMRLPVMSTARAETLLEWKPRHDAAYALSEFFTGLNHGAGAATAPLEPDTGRVSEFASGVGERP